MDTIDNISSGGESVLPSGDSGRTTISAQTVNITDNLDTSTDPPAPSATRFPVQGTTQEQEAAIRSLLGNRKHALMTIGSIGNQEVAFGLDSNAQGSFMDADLLDAFPNLFPPVQPLPVPLSGTGVFGTSQLATGYVDLVFKLGTHQFQHPVVVMPALNNMLLLGIDFLSRQEADIKVRTSSATVIFSGGRSIDAILHPLRFEDDGLQALLMSEKKIPVGQTLYTVAYLHSTDERDISTLSRGEEGYLRQDDRGTKNLPGLRVWEKRLHVDRGYRGKGYRLVVTLQNMGNTPITVRAGTSLGFYSAHTLRAMISHHDDLPTEQLPDQAFIDHLKTLTLTPERMEAILNVLFRRRAAFAMHPRKPGLNRLVQHVIDTGTHPPIRCKPHNTTHEQDQIMRKEVLDMLEKGIIRPSNSPWAFPALIVKKPDNSWRWCFDARKLNSITRRDSFTLPKAQELLQQFSGAQWFSVADAAAGFWQVPLSEDSIPKCAFITRWGLYEFLVMPFGLSNSPATWQRLMTLVLGDMRWDRATVFVDYVCIYSQTWDQHLLYLDAFLARCIEHGISLKLTKCQFGQQEVKYLGRRITGAGHTMDPAKVKAVAQTPPPTNLEELGSVLGLFGHYRQYVKGYAEIVEPLLAMARHANPSYYMKRGKPRHHPRRPAKPKPVKPWQWGADEQKAFDTLKACLTNPPVLAHPDMTGAYPFRLETDASSVGTGAVLIQSFPDGDKPIGYYSYTLKSNEREWSTTEREAYAALLGMRNFRPIIAGSHFTLVVDHQALRYLKSIKDPHGRIGRWIMEMQQYDFDIDHRPGQLHVVPDALSRAPIIRAVEAASSSDRDLSDPPEVYPTTIFAVSATTVATDSPGDESESPNEPHVELPSRADIIAQQQQDPVLRGYIQYLTQGNMSGIPEEIKPLLLDLDNYAVIRDVLHHIWTVRTPNQPKKVRFQLVVPEPMRPTILRAHHDNILAGHRGVDATYQLIRRNYHWVNMLADIYDYVQSCETCAAVKTSHRGAAAGLRPVQSPIPTQPFGMISIDFLGPLPETANGNKYILVVNDIATRYAMSFATRTADAEEVADVLVHRVFLEYGPPAVILSDRGSHFHNYLVQAIEQLFLTRHVFSSGYRPQTAGITERMNQTLCDLLAMYVERYQTDWDRLLPYVTFAYRNLYHPTVKGIPFFLLFGYEPILPHQLHELPAHLNQTLAEADRNTVARQLNEARQLAAQTVANVQRRIKERYDERRKQPVQYAVGDLVFALKPQLAPGGTKMKLAKIYDGPYRIEAYLSGSRTMRLVRMRSTNNPGGEIRLAHVDNVKPFKPSSRTRPDVIYEVAEPALSTQQETRIVDHLERAVSTAAAALGAPRARAIISHAVGQTDLPPLPPQLQAILPHPSDPRPPSPPQSQPPPPQPEVPLAQEWRRDPRPWFMPPVAPPTADQHLGYSARGRTLRKPTQVYAATVTTNKTASTIDYSNLFL